MRKVDGEFVVADGQKKKKKQKAAPRLDVFDVEVAADADGVVGPVGGARGKVVAAVVDDERRRRRSGAWIWRGRERGQRKRGASGSGWGYFSGG